MGFYLGIQSYSHFKRASQYMEDLSKTGRKYTYHIQLPMINVSKSADRSGGQLLLLEVYVLL